MKNYFDKNKKFLIAMAVLAAAGIGVFGLAGQAQMSVVREFKVFIV